VKRTRKASPAQIEAREAKLSASLETLATEIDKLVNSEDWKRMLETAAKFHDYSWRNCLLILRQCPHATRVAGFKKWQEFGRRVVSGPGSGLAILAPVIVKTTEEERKEDERETKVVGYRLAYVFDVSQTEGEPLPEDIRPVLLEGEAPNGAWNALVKIAKDEGWSVNRVAPEVLGESKGDFDGKHIRVRDDLSEAASVKTLIHEIAHGKLGHLKHYRDERSQAEVEAESVAYVVGTDLGLDTSDYSLPYIAGWAEEGKTAEVLAATATRVLKTASTILDEMGLHDQLTEEVAA
jgi:DNA primase